MTNSLLAMGLLLAIAAGITWYVNSHREEDHQRKRPGGHQSQ